VKKLLFLGSSCIYSKFAPQPIKEDALLTGALEQTNEWYWLAKISGIKLALAYRRQFGADFISIMPTNLYGPADNYHSEDSHVPAALIRRFHEAKISGQSSARFGERAVRHEFMAADYLGAACVFVMKHYSGDDFLNVGTGEGITIADFARMVVVLIAPRNSTCRGRTGLRKATGRVSAERPWLESENAAPRWARRGLRGLFGRRWPRKGLAVPHSIKGVVHAEAARRLQQNCRLALLIQSRPRVDIFDCRERPCCRRGKGWVRFAPMDVFALVSRISPT
jgi:hypothetical protein